EGCFWGGRQNATREGPAALEQFSLPKHFTASVAAASLVEFKEWSRRAIGQFLPPENEILVGEARMVRVSKVEHFVERVRNRAAVRRPPLVRRGIAVGDREQLHRAAAYFAVERARLRIADGLLCHGPL